jgi:hypothetical protein
MNDSTIPKTLAAYWRQQIDQWQSSGQSQKTFCQANALSYHRFLYWRGKFKSDTGNRQATQSSGGFVAVDYRPEFNGGLSLFLPNGLVLRGISADNVPVVRQLLEQL